MNNNKNAFKMTKAESDARRYHKEIYERSKIKINEPKSVKTQTISVQQPNKNTSAKTTVKSNSKSLDKNSPLYELLDKRLTVKNGNNKQTSEQMKFSPARPPGWEIKESPQKQTSQKEPKKEKNGPGIRDFGAWLGKNAMNGMTKSSEGIMATLDLIMPTDFLGKYDPFSNLNEYYSKQADYWEGEAKKASQKMGGKGWEYGGEFVSSTISSIPDLVALWASGGASAGASLTKAGGQALKSGVSMFDDVADTARIFKNILKDTVKSPAFKVSYFKNVGKEYEDALENGANIGEAIGASTLSSFLNSAFDAATPEMLEGFLKNKGFPKLVQKAGRMIDAGTVNSIQGTIEPAISNVIYDHDTPTFSMEDENAPINLKRILKDFGMGAASEGVNIAAEDVLNLNTTKSNSIKPTKKSGKTDSISIEKKMNKVKEELFRQYNENKKLYGRLLADNLHLDQWRKYIKSLPEKEFDEYINSLENK